MPRPDFTPEKLAEYEKAVDRAMEDPRIPSFMRTLPVMRDVVMSGVWLSDQLFNEGAPEKEVHDVTFAAGQMSVGRDPWACSEKCLVLWREGRGPKPGPELGDRLLTGDVSDLPPGGLRLEKVRQPEQRNKP